MLTLKPIKDKNEIYVFFEKVGLEVYENSGCVVCKDGASVLGFCLYDLDSEKMIVRYIEPLGDLSLSDGILRSTLHVAAERSIMKTYYVPALETFFEKLGFIKDKQEKLLNIDKLFQSCCNCNNG